jgi:hypothetical protein
MTGRDPSFGSLGFHQLLFTIEEISGGYAYGTDQFLVSRQIPIAVQRAKGAAPSVGEQWLITKDLGPWAFAAIMNNSGSAGQLPDYTSPGHGIALIDDSPHSGDTDIDGITYPTSGILIEELGSADITIQTTDDGSRSYDLGNIHLNSGADVNIEAAGNVSINGPEVLSILQSGSGPFDVLYITANGHEGMYLSASNGSIDIETTGSDDSILLHSSYGGVSSAISVQSGGGVSIAAGTGSLSTEIGLFIDGTTGMEIFGTIYLGTAHLSAWSTPGKVHVGTTTSDEVGFFSATPITRPTVTGSRGGNAALASLLTALANLGLIVNSST